MITLGSRLGLPKKAAFLSQVRRSGTPAGPVSYLGQVATRCQLPNSSNTGNHFLRCRSAHIVREAVTSLKLVFPNCWVDQTTKAEAISPGTMTLTAAIEYPAGTYTQVKFSGSATGTTSGALLTSDAVAVSIPANATFWVRTYQANPNTIVFIEGVNENAPINNNASLGDTLDVSPSSMTDNTMGGAYGANLGQYRYGPVIIAATTVRPACILVGDSRTIGKGDTADASGDIGNLQRSLGPAVGYLSWALGGYKATDVISTHTILQSLAPYFSHVFCELGINDIEFNSKTAAQALASVQTIWGYFPGKKIGQSTIEPRSTSSNSWATVGNQTASANNAQRTAFNDLIRALPAGLDAAYEVADQVETARNSGIWKAPGYTADGLHGSQTAYLAIKNSNAISPAILVGSSLNLDFTTGMPAGVTVASSPAGYAKTAAGVLTSFAANAGRRTNLGLLVEPAATNLFLQSNDITSTWVSAAVTVAADTATAPDGTTTADTMTLDSSSATTHRINQLPSGLATLTTYTASTYVKLASAPAYLTWRVRVPDGSGAPAAITYNVATGAVSASFGGASASIPPTAAVEAMGNGWFRCSVTFQSSTAITNMYLHVVPDDTTIGGSFNEAGTPNGGNAWAGNGTSALSLWGLQIEAGSKATSLIPTTAAQASRTADQIQFSIPSGITRLTYTFDDNSTQLVTGLSPGVYTIPTTLNRSQIKTVVGS